MSKQPYRTVTTYSSQSKTTRTTESSSRTVSKTQTTSTGYVSPYRSTATTDRAIGSVAASTPKTYQPVYNHARRSDASSSFARNSPIYSSLQAPPSSFSKDALSSTAGNLFYSFRTGADKQRSASLVNNERVATGSSPSWKSPTAVSSIPTAASSSPTVASNTVAQDARPYRSVSTSVIPRTTSASLERYDLRKPAYVLIFHHLFKKDPKHFRKGSELDLKLITNFFKDYNVKIAEICEDFAVAKVKKKMSEVRVKNFGNYSCVIVIIMSHGWLNDQIKTVDGAYQLDDAIVEPTLMNESLKGKPKLFFVQACKGDALMEADATRTATNKFDILKCFSTYEGTLSIRYTQTGTTFIQTLFELIRQESDKEIIDIMRLMRTTFSINSIPQAPTETSTLTKQFYFSDLKKPRRF